MLSMILWLYILAQDLDLATKTFMKLTTDFKLLFMHQPN